MVGPAPKGTKAVRYLWYSSPCSPYVGSWPPGKGQVRGHPHQAELSKGPSFVIHIGPFVIQFRAP